MSQRIRLIGLLLVLGCSAARAQYDVLFSHYWDMETTFNPAATGKQPKLNVIGAYAMSFAGFENNPNTFYVGGDMPFFAMNSYHGVGLSLMSDQLGLFTHQRVAAQYAHQQKLFGGTLSIGVQAGFLNEKFDGSDLDLEDSSDPAFASGQMDGSSIDLGAGLYFQHKRWYVGLSAQHLTAPLVELGERNELQIDRTYYLTGGYNIKLKNPFLSIPTSMIARTDGVAYRADVTARLQYNHENRNMYAGLSYSPTNSVTVLIGGHFQGFNVGYSYEVYTSAISPVNGSHELFVGYQQDINLYKKGKNKHKSVRYL